jgi:hypothetical protein
MKDPLYESIFRIKEAVEFLQDGVLSGVDSWDKYNQLVGRGQGLKEALDIINSVLREDEESDNDRE